MSERFDQALGLSVAAITLNTFTDESVTNFLEAVAAKARKVADNAGASPWLPNTNTELKGTVIVPTGDGGAPGVFNALTHPAVTRAVMAGDPANIQDTISLMGIAADSNSEALRLLTLRIAARWNNAMRLGCEHHLVYEDGAPELPEPQINMPLPETRVVEKGGSIVVVDVANGEETQAGRSHPAKHEAPVEPDTTEPPAETEPQEDTQPSTTPFGSTPSTEETDEVPVINDLTVSTRN